VSTLVTLSLCAAFEAVVLTWTLRQLRRFHFARLFGDFAVMTEGPASDAAFKRARSIIRGECVPLRALAVEYRLLKKGVVL
jgi:hypothetical protein